MGILIDFAKGRVEEIKDKVKKFIKEPIKTLQTEQPIRKAILLEYLDKFRPNVYSRWQYKIVTAASEPLVKLPKKRP